MIECRNQLAKPSANDILDKLSAEQHIDEGYKPFGDGHAGEKIVEIIMQGVKKA
jgi:UDP-N-acetylglucosamine 2-epimerase (non-hydrolysing)/UDP-GlcNAc3NAcA epimerase